MGDEAVESPPLGAAGEPAVGVCCPAEPFGSISRPGPGEPAEGLVPVPAGGVTGTPGGVDAAVVGWPGGAPGWAGAGWDPVG